MNIVYTTPEIASMVRANNTSFDMIYPTKYEPNGSTYNKVDLSGLDTQTKTFLTLFDEYVHNVIKTTSLSRDICNHPRWALGDYDKYLYPRGRLTSCNEKDKVIVDNSMRDEFPISIKVLKSGELLVVIIPKETLIKIGTLNSFYVNRFLEALISELIKIVDGGVLYTLPVVLSYIRLNKTQEV